MCSTLLSHLFSIIFKYTHICIFLLILNGNYDWGHWFCKSLNDMCILWSIIYFLFFLMYYRTRFKVIDLLQANKDKVRSVF